MDAQAGKGGVSALLLPALAVLCVLLGLRARVDVYTAFVRGAQEGLRTLAGMCPYLAAILMVTALWRQTGLTDALTELLSPLLLRGQRDGFVPGCAVSGCGEGGGWALCRARRAAGLCLGRAGRGSAGLIPTGQGGKSSLHFLPHAI